MVKTKYIILILLVVMIGIWIALRLSPTEEKRVKKQFHLLSEWGSKDSRESAFTMAKKTKDIGTLFAEACRLEADNASLSGTYTPDEISSFAAQARLQFSEVSLRFYDLDVEFPNEDTAKVLLTAKLTGRLIAGEYVNEVHELTSVLKKIENRWLFSSFEVIEVLEK